MKCKSSVNIDEKVVIQRFAIVTTFISFIVFNFKQYV